MILFTRADRSPLFADRAQLGDERRRKQLLARCRRGLEAALSSRRASRGLQRTGTAPGGRVTIEGIAEVADAEQRGLWTRWRARLAAYMPWIAPPADERAASELHPTRFGHNVRAGAGHRVSDELSLDYVAVGSANELLERLHGRVVDGGRVTWGLASVDCGSWVPGAGTDSLEDVTAWVAQL